MPEVIMNGPEGRLEGRYQHGEGPNAPIALMLHPAPAAWRDDEQQGDLLALSRFAERGFSVLRFNFRGVGRSQGKFDRGEGELSDAASALDWLQTYNPNASACWIAGFSFGAWIGMQLLMRRPEISGFICVAPPANIYDFSFLAPCPSSGLMVQGDQDDVVPHEAVAKLVQKLSNQRDIKIDYKIIKGANHFFNEHLDQLQARGRRVSEPRPARRRYGRQAKAQGESGSALTRRADQIRPMSGARSSPPVMGCGTPVVRGNAERQARQRAHRQIGEGLGLQHIAVPAHAFHRRRPARREPRAQRRHQRRVVPAAAGDQPAPRRRRQAVAAARDGGGGEGHQGRGTVGRRQIRRRRVASKASRSRDLGAGRAK